MMSRHSVVRAQTADEIIAVRDLILEYVDGLGIDIARTGFAAERVTFPGSYAPQQAHFSLRVAIKGWASAASVCTVWISLVPAS
ncbi:hypothetical protein [Mesorhizobium sp. YR577]|uniref:hypothetical protein n=1 Tax=Mesorhizobium sp. YR577 TaxID=1884373 RepID=UPI0008E6AAB7|nr:hypothetical protein SAMN05518861_11755 [Mesorhizobium sp. YR577]